MKGIIYPLYMTVMYILVVYGKKLTKIKYSAVSVYLGFTRYGFHGPTGISIPHFMN